MQQTKSRVTEDLSVLGEYFAEKQEFHNRQEQNSKFYPSLEARHDFRKLYIPLRVLGAQGSLDMKYLTDRYNRGRARVAELMQDSQRYVAVRELDEALPDILKVIQNPQKAATHLVRRHAPDSDCDQGT